MALDPDRFAEHVSALSHALQAAVLIAAHLQLASSAAAQDALALSRNLKRATDVIQQCRIGADNGQKKGDAS